MTQRQTIMRAVAKARLAWQTHVREIALAEGIPDSYRTIFLFLCRNPGSSQRQIAEFAGVTNSAVNQTVKHMLEEGYLRKEQDTSDRRGTRLYLTERGAGIARKLFAKMDASDDAITAMLGPEKEAELIACLEQLADFVRKELGGC